MLKLKIIALFLSVVMAIQMLPVAQIGYVLGSNQWTEELPHNTSGDDCKSGEVFFGKTFLPASHSEFSPAFTISRQDIYIHSSEQIPSNHSTDVVTPPPDVVA